jgi:hypothetical protein
VLTVNAYLLCSTNQTEARDMTDFEPAFSAFMVAAQAKCSADFAAAGGTPEHIASYSPKLVAERGRRYIRIVSDDNCGSRHAWCFVDMTNGAVLKCDGWKSPAKGARGSIYDAHKGCSRACWTGVA